MKRISILLLTAAMACKTSGPNADRHSTGNPVQLYLTYDIAVNSCILNWENTLKQVYVDVSSGNLALYADAALKQRLSTGESAERCHFKTRDLNTGETVLIPMESFRVNGENGHYRFYQIDPFTGSQITVGYLSNEELLAGMGNEEASMFRLLSAWRGFPVGQEELDGSALYVHSMLLIDSIQKHLAWQTENAETYHPLNDSLQPMPDSVLKERIHQLQDSLDPERKLVVKTIRVPEYDLWKGFMAYGNYQSGSMDWRAFGLLYHPATKYGGFNPGKIPWFAIEHSEITARDPEIALFLRLLANHALLYLLDPVHHTSDYFVQNHIDIENTRYPGGHRH